MHPYGGRGGVGGQERGARDEAAGVADEIFFIPKNHIDPGSIGAGIKEVYIYPGWPVPVEKSGLKPVGNRD